MTDTTRKIQVPKKKIKVLKSEILKEVQFLRNIFSISSLSSIMKGNTNEDDEYAVLNETSKPQATESNEPPQRARSIAELEQKLEIIKSKHNFTMKNKLAKKSAASKLSKKLKKQDRNKPRVKIPKEKIKLENNIETTVITKKPTLPVFNSDAKLVFSKFDFSGVGEKDHHSKSERDPKKMLENIKNQEERFRKMEESNKGDKVKEIKEKIVWKNVLNKASGEKIKDDPLLLKKSIKKNEQKKKHSKKEWDNRIQQVEQKKEDRQKKRKDNISKKKKDKKTKSIKSSIKRGRVVI